MRDFVSLIWIPDLRLVYLVLLLACYLYNWWLRMISSSARFTFVRHDGFANNNNGSADSLGIKGIFGGWVLLPQQIVLLQYTFMVIRFLGMYMMLVAYYMYHWWFRVVVTQTHFSYMTDFHYGVGIPTVNCGMVWMVVKYANVIECIF